MNIKDYSPVIHHLLLAIDLQPTSEKCKFLYLPNQLLSKFLFQNLKVVGLLGEKFDFSIALGI